MNDVATGMERPIFNARLTPHRSMGPQGFRMLMAATFLATAALSLPFYLMGAWPIVGFLGLDVLGLYVAFKMNFRAAQAHDTYSAERASRSNDAQIITLGARVVGLELAKAIVDKFLQSNFDGGRSTAKVDAIAAYEGRAGGSKPQ